jgi:hypothetical protein
MPRNHRGPRRARKPTAASKPAAKLLTKSLDDSPDENPVWGEGANDSQ